MRSKRGRRKVLFGTNFPMLGHEQALEGLYKLGLDEGTRPLPGRRARRVLGL